MIIPNNRLLFGWTNTPNFINSISFNTLSWMAIRSSFTAITCWIFDLYEKAFEMILFVAHQYKIPLRIDLYVASTDKVYHEGKKSNYVLSQSKNYFSLYKSCVQNNKLISSLFIISVCPLSNIHSFPIFVYLSHKDKH